MADFTPGHISVVNYEEVSGKVDSLFSDVSLEFVIDGGGSAITTGVKGYLVVPFHGTVSHVTVLADQVGSIVIDIWRIAMNQINSDFPPTDANSITNGNEPTIDNDYHFVVGSTGWADGNKMNKYDIVAFNVDSCDTITRVTIEISIARSTTPTRED